MLRGRGIVSCKIEDRCCLGKVLWRYSRVRACQGTRNDEDIPIFLHISGKLIALF